MDDYHPDKKIRCQADTSHPFPAHIVWKVFFFIIYFRYTVLKIRTIFLDYKPSIVSVKYCIMWQTIYLTKTNIYLDHHNLILLLTFGQKNYDESHKI